MGAFQFFILSETSDNFYVDMKTAESKSAEWMDIFVHDPTRLRGYLELTAAAT